MKNATIATALMRMIMMALLATFLLGSDALQRVATMIACDAEVPIGEPV
jgi:hypothetical protein